MTYQFSTDWFNISEIKANILNLLDTTSQHNILEIGSFEGASSTFFSDNLLDNPNSTLTCVDPFSTDDQTTPLTNNTMSIFFNNITKSQNHTKVTVYNMFSNEFFNNIYKQTFIPKYDLIYIDGSHLLDDITVDFNYCLRLAKKNGIIWIDDYGANHIGITDHINNLYEHNKEDLEIIHKGYQIAFRKK